MKTLKRALSALVAVALAATTFAAAATMTASAAEDNVFKWTAFNRHIGWGEWPKEVTYTDGGSFTIEDTGRFQRQYQLYFPITAQEDKDAILEMIKTACSEYDGNLKVDVSVFNNANTNFTEIEEGTSVNCHLTLEFKAKDLDPMLADDDRIISDKWSTQGWFAPDGEARPLVLSVDDYDSWYSDPEYYSDFEVTGFYLNFMNYACNAVKDNEIEYNDITVKPGTGGLGFTKLSYSALYIDGADTPAVGNDLGAGFEFIPNENREQVTNPKNGRLLDKYPGTFIIDGKKYLQNDDGTQIDGPLGNGADIVRVPVGEVDPTNPQPTDPQPTDPQPTDPQPTDPQEPVIIENPTTELGDVDMTTNNDGTVTLTATAKDGVAFMKWVISGEYEIVSGSLTDGTITIKPKANGVTVTPDFESMSYPTIYGDANGDTEIDMRDVLLIRKRIAKQPVELDIEASDVTHDGGVDMRDVLKLRKFIAKQPVDLDKA